MNSQTPQRKITSLSRSGPSLARKPPQPLRKSLPEQKDENISENQDSLETISFSIYKFSPTYVKTWDGPQTDCQICRESLIQPCIICISQNKKEPCMHEEGRCGHSFHKHCIDRWIANSPVCPICNKKWEPNTE